MVMMTMGRWLFHIWLAAVNNIKVSHHSCCMVLNDVAMVHPCSWSVIRHPGDLDPAPGLQVVRILPRPVSRSLAILLDHLEEETVQVEGVVHPAGIRHFPDLQVADHDGLVIPMYGVVDAEVLLIPYSRING